MFGSVGFLSSQRRQTPEMFTHLPGRSRQGHCLPWRRLAPSLRFVYEAPIEATATIVRVRKPGVFDARLPNGKITCAHPAKSLASEAGQLVPGTKVVLELTPFDFDTARVARRAP